MEMGRARRRPGAPGSRTGRRRRGWDRGRGAAAPAWRGPGPAARAWPWSPPPPRACAAPADRAANPCQVASVRSTVNTPTAAAQRRRMVAVGRGELGQIAMPRLPPRRGEGTAERPDDQPRLPAPAPRDPRRQVGADGGAIADGTEAAAPLGEVDGGHRHLDETPPAGGRADQHLGLEDEPFAARAHGVDQPGGVHAKSRLRVGHGSAREPVDEESGHAYRRDPAGGKGHRHRALPDLAQTPTDDERIGGLGGRREEPREIVGIVLAIAVHGHDALGVARERLVQPTAERRPLAAPTLEPDHVGSRGRGHLARAVRRAVVHDEDVAVARGAPHHVADGAGLVVDGNDDQVITHGPRPRGPGPRRSARSDSRRARSRGRARGIRHARVQRRRGHAQRAQASVLAEERRQGQRRDIARPEIARQESRAPSRPRRRRRSRRRTRGGSPE